MLNGIDAISFPIHTRAEDFCEFLMEVRGYNPVGRICLVLDNFATHKAKKVREKAKELNIELIVNGGVKLSNYGGIKLTTNLKSFFQA